jgi:hypothetical protein
MENEMSGSFLAQLRAAAALCPDKNYEARLRNAALDVHQYAIEMRVRFTTESMTDLNAAWSRAARLLKEAPQIGDAPPSGTPAVAELELKVA